MKNMSVENINDKQREKGKVRLQYKEHIFCDKRNFTLTPKYSVIKLNMTWFLVQKLMK